MAFREFPAFLLSTANLLSINWDIATIKAVDLCRITGSARVTFGSVTRCQRQRRIEKSDEFSMTTPSSRSSRSGNSGHSGCLGALLAVVVLVWLLSWLIPILHAVLETVGPFLLLLGAGWIIYQIADNFGLFDPPAEEQRRQEEERRRQEEADLSLTCLKCGGLAVPIRGTQNRYRCTCGHQFANAKHGL